MRKLIMMMALAAVVLMGAQSAMAQCCGAASDGTQDCIGAAAPEGCVEEAAPAACAAGDGSNGEGCVCVAGNCICTGGTPCDAQACADAADAACEN